MPGTAQHRSSLAAATAIGTAAPAAERVRLPGSFAMHRGGVLEQVEIACERWGVLTPAGDNAVLVFTGLSPGTHASSSSADPRPGWWEYMIGPGKPIDTSRFHVVCVNSLGSCFGSTGPASIDPRTGQPYGPDFPALSVEDIARASHETLRALGIGRVRAVVGPSLGGMSALAYGILYPDEVDDLVLISAACHAEPFAIAIHSLQREIIRSDPAWHGGRYERDAAPVSGMRLARKLGLLSYRSAAEWQERFARKRVMPPRTDQGMEAPEFQVESYLDHNAGKFAGDFDANSYLSLSHAMDWFDVADHGGSVEAGLARVGARRSLVIGVESDWLFPPQQQRRLADGLRQSGRVAECVLLPSVQGHDAFLVDEARFAPVVGEFLAGA
jgi:homoserine O-acetyltransferase